MTLNKLLQGIICKLPVVVCVSVRFSKSGSHSEVSPRAQAAIIQR